MGDLRPKLTGKADMSKVGEIIKKKLSPGWTVYPTWLP
jgi:uncharacterized protein YqeY